MNSDFGTIAFGTVMGGAGSRLAEGNFWQGAVTGLIVSMMNHVMHNVSNRRFIDRRLISKGYNPDSFADVYQSQLSDFAEEIFPELMEQTDSPAFELKAKI